jgi:predicted nucleic acid-binding protein
MQLIVDASVLVGELLRKAGRERLCHPELLARTTAPDGPRALELLIPEHTWSETQHEYQKRITRLSLHKSLLESESKALLEVGLSAVKANVQIVPHAAYAPLEDEARRRIPRDPNDWSCVALALAMNCGIWTNDQDFFGCGLPTWTTATLTEWLIRHE